MEIAQLPKSHGNFLWQNSRYCCNYAIMAKHIENLVISKLESIILICHYGNSWAAKIIELKYIFRMGPMENGIICKFVAIMQICNIAVLCSIPIIINSTFLCRQTNIQTRQNVSISLLCI